MKLDLFRVAAMARIAASPRAVLHSLAQLEAFEELISNFDVFHTGPFQKTPEYRQWQASAKDVLNTLYDAAMPTGDIGLLFYAIANNPSDSKEVDYLTSIRKKTFDRLSSNPPPKQSVYKDALQFSEGFQEHTREFMKLLKEVDREKGPNSKLKSAIGALPQVESKLKKFEQDAVKLREKVLGAPTPDKKRERLYYHGVNP